jgi:guanylate kinase
MPKPALPVINLPDRPPLLVIVSGPSGVGKDAALKRMQQLRHQFHFLVTNTTRPPRGDEIDGVDYHFITKEKFAQIEQRGDFLEHAVVYGFDYGNSRSEVRAALARGQDVIMRIDVQGAASIRRILPDAIFIMLLPPSMDALEARIRKRRSDPEEYLQIRLHAARLEMNEAKNFDYVIVNEDNALDETADLIYAITRVEKLRVKPRRVVV